MSGGEPIPPFLESCANGVRIRVKAVPGARRNEIAGPLGDRLKVRVSAPAEGGKANKAIAETLAAALQVRRRDVVLVSGATHPEKVFEARGISVGQAETRIL